MSLPLSQLTIDVVDDSMNMSRSSHGGSGVLSHLKTIRWPLVPITYPFNFPISISGAGRQLLHVCTGTVRLGFTPPATFGNGFFPCIESNGP